MKSLGLKLIGALAAVFVLIFPFVNSHNLFYAPMNAKAFYIITATLLTGIIFAYKVYKGETEVGLNKHSYVFLALCLLTGIYLLSSFLGVNPSMSLYGDIIRGAGALFVIALALEAWMLSYLLKIKDWRYVGLAVILSSAIYSFIYLVDSLLFPGGALGISAPQFLFGNSTFAGTFVCIGIISTLIAIFDSSKPSYRKWFYLILVIQILHPTILNPEIILGHVSLGDIIKHPGIILSDAQASSMTALLALMYAGTRFLITKITKNKNFLTAYHVAFGAGLLLAVLMLFIPGSPIQKKFAENSNNARLILWESSFDAIKERPVLGYGPENFDLAYQAHFDNQLYLKKNLGEIWFDRAHNYFVDTLIELGVLGLLAWLSLFFFTSRIFVLASKRGLISNSTANILIVLICANILQIQTSFQTVVTYFYIFLIVGYALYLEREISSGTKKITSRGNIVMPVLLITVALFLFWRLSVIESSRQKDLVSVIKTRDNSGREALIESAIGDGHSLTTLRIGSGSLIKGITKGLASAPLSAVGRSQALKELEMYEKGYEAYLVKHPDHYRARMNLAYLYMFETIMGNERLDKAKGLLAESEVLSPNNPLTRAMEALAYMYAGDFKTAEVKIAEAEAINPEIKFTQDVKSHIALQKTRFPKISFLSLENL